MSHSARISSLSRLGPDFKFSLTNGDFPIDQAHVFIYNLFRDSQLHRLDTAKMVWIDLDKEPITTENDRIIQDENRKLLRRIVDDIREWKDLLDYMNRTSPIVAEYVAIRDKMYSMWSEGKSNTEEFQKLMNERSQKIRAYLSALEFYIPVCEISVAIVESSGAMKNNSGRKGKSSEIDINAFKLAILRFQGKQENKIPLDLYNQLDIYFSSWGTFTREKAAQLPYDKRGRREGTSFQLMIETLKNTNNSDWYRDCNLICHVYWGWILPDISHLEEKLIENFVKTQTVFARIKDGQRSSNLNIDVLLRKHLQALNFPCEASDFRTIKSPGIRQSYETLIKRMFEEAGVPYIPGL